MYLFWVCQRSFLGSDDESMGNVKRIIKTTNKLCNNSLGNF